MIYLYVNSHTPFKGLINLDSIMFGLKFQMPQVETYIYHWFAKFTTKAKMSCAPLNLQISKLEMIETQFVKTNKNIYLFCVFN